MKESKVEALLVKHLEKKSWKVKTGRKRPGEHGVDVRAHHPKWCRYLFVEAKGGSGKNKHQEIHHSFYVVMGQLLSRMDIEGNSSKKGRTYGIAIPHSWAKVYKRKILKMKYGWSLLKPRVFLVKWNGEVIEKTHSAFLKV